MEERILLLTGLVTTQTAVGVFFRARPEGKDQLIRFESFGLVPPGRLLGLDVSLARTVTGFAADDRRSSGFQSCMRRLVKLHDLRSMTGSTGTVANQLIWRHGLSRQGPCDGRSIWRTCQALR